MCRTHVSSGNICVSSKNIFRTQVSDTCVGHLCPLKTFCGHMCPTHVSDTCVRHMYPVKTFCVSCESIFSIHVSDTCVGHMFPNLYLDECLDTFFGHNVTHSQ